MASFLILNIKYIFAATNTTRKKKTVASAFLLKWVFQTLALGFLKPKLSMAAVAQPGCLSQVASGDLKILKSVGTEAKFFKRATTHG